MTLNDLEQMTNYEISPKVAAEASGLKELDLRYDIQNACKKAENNRLKVKEILGFSAHMNGRNARIVRPSFIKYIKELEE